MTIPVPATVHCSGGTNTKQAFKTPCVGHSQPKHSATWVSDVVISPVSCSSDPGLFSFQSKTRLRFGFGVLVVCFLLTDSRIWNDICNNNFQFSTFSSFEMLSVFSAVMFLVLMFILFLFFSFSIYWSCCCFGWASSPRWRAFLGSRQQTEPWTIMFVQSLNELSWQSQWALARVSMFWSEIWIRIFF